MLASLKTWNSIFCCVRRELGEEKELLDKFVSFLHSRMLECNCKALVWVSNNAFAGAKLYISPLLLKFELIC